MICNRCDGTGWIREMRDDSRRYGKPQMNSYSRVCPKCNGKGRVAEMPLFEIENGGESEGIQGV